MDIPFHHNETAQRRPDFSSVFRTRRDAWLAMLELSRRQCALIEADDYPQLLEVLGRKQRLLEQLDTVNARHRRIRARWRSHRDHLDPHTRDDCEHVLAETEAILAELRDHEQTSTRQLVERRDRTAQALKAIAAADEFHKPRHDEPAAPTHRRLDVFQ